MNNYSKKRALTTLALVAYLLGLPALKLFGCQMPWSVALFPISLPLLFIATVSLSLLFLYGLMMFVEMLNDIYPDKYEDRLSNE